MYTTRRLLQIDISSRKKIFPLNRRRLAVIIAICWEGYFLSGHSAVLSFVRFHSTYVTQSSVSLSVWSDASTTISSSLDNKIVVLLSLLHLLHFVFFCIKSRDTHFPCSSFFGAPGSAIWYSPWNGADANQSGHIEATTQQVTCSGIAYNAYTHSRYKTHGQRCLLADIRYLNDSCDIRPTSTLPCRTAFGSVSNQRTWPTQDGCAIWLLTTVVVWTLLKK